MITRRGLLTAAGGGAAVLGAAGLARAWQQGLILFSGDDGLGAWDDWNQRRFAGPLALVSAGVLASSPHNTQPWRFAVGRYGVDVFEVPERDLGAMDPFGRERLAGLGAAIHSMALATTSIGRAAVVRLLPDASDPRHVARLELGPEPTPGGAPPPEHPLVRAIGRRHTDRRAWRGGAVAPADLRALAATAGSKLVRIDLLTPQSAAGQRLAALTLEATQAIAGDAEMMAASQRWMRHGPRQWAEMQDGLSPATSGIPAWQAAAAAMLPPLSPETEGRFWLEATRDTALPTASMFALISVADPWDRRSALLAGMAWQRLHLTAVTLGLAAQPLNQLPEMIDRDRALGRPPGFAKAAAALLPDPAWRPTFALRLGHPPDLAPASVRRPVSAVMGPPARLGYDVARSAEETRRQQDQLARRQAAK